MLSSRLSILRLFPIVFSMNFEHIKVIINSVQLLIFLLNNCVTFVIFTSFFFYQNVCSTCIYLVLGNWYIHTTYLDHFGSSIFKSAYYFVYTPPFL